jgi:hyperosmotically inducible periplasmic protein
MRMMKKNLGVGLFGAVVGFLMLLYSANPATARSSLDKGAAAGSMSLTDKVRHQLVMLPYYGMFDNLEFDVKDDGTVVLSGDVVRPILKSDAVNAVRGLEGDVKVVDKINVLPLSPYDDRLRRGLYWTMFANTQLDRYLLPPVSPIHIIVRNGNVVLTGVVARAADRDVAGILANSVPGVFSVTNDLRVEK